MKPIEIFREKLKKGQNVFGTSITFIDPLVTDAVGSSAEFAWIDLEHCNMSPDALSGHILAARSRGIPSLVRVQASNTPFIKTILDSGADGIVVPQIVDAQEVKSVINDCRYPPLGKRGYGPRVPSNFGRNGGDDYVEWSNENIFVSVQIENKEALDFIDEILSVSGIDSIVIGPCDLSASLGVMGKLQHPIVEEAIMEIVEKARKKNIYVGAGMGTDLQFANYLLSLGVQWFQVGCDYNYIAEYVDNIMFCLKNYIDIGKKTEK